MSLILASTAEITALQSLRNECNLRLFTRGHATLELAVLVGTSLRNIVKIASGSRITAPAQPSATGLPLYPALLDASSHFHKRLCPLVGW